MELQDRIAAVRKAAGLTQEQLGELVGVTRQAVSKWESGQTVPDALTIAKLCKELNVSADYVLLGREPEEITAPVSAMPEECPCCGREVKGTVCPVCGYPMPNYLPRGPKYAVIATYPPFMENENCVEQIVQYCGLEREETRTLMDRYVKSHDRVVLRRGIDDQAAQWIASHLDHDFFMPLIVEDHGEAEEDLIDRPKALEQPAQNKPLGFWGVVGAVVVALLILSFL